MPLFHPRIIEKHTKTLSAVPIAHADILGSWAESLTKGAFNRETSHDGEFIQRILIDVLGYVGSSAGAKWTVAKNQPVGSGNVDVALGSFSVESVQIVAPFELKGAKTRDLDAIMPGRNKSPVQQAWEYAMDAKGAKWVLVSNYREIRLYAVGYGRKDYEKFDLSQLSNPAQYARFMLLLSAESLLGNRTQALLKESENKDKEITDKLYLDYKTLRAQMIDTLTKDNPSVPVLEIIQYTQTILDRILFVAFAEDRGLLPDDTLKSCYEDRGKWNPQPAWANFKGLFHSIDKGNPPLKIPGYNGGLFAENDALNNLNVSDTLCEGFKTIGSYDFESDVSVNILGHIFEQSITDLEAIKSNLSSDDPDFDKKKSKRKKDGIFYTPPYITRYIVEQAVGGWLNDRKKEIGFDKLPMLEDGDYASIQVITRGARKGTVTYNARIEKYVKAWEAYKAVLSSIKVLDPACGSGAFLNEVFDYLFREGQIVNSELTTLNGGQQQLFRWDTHILANNIYGVDINQESVEITKLSLWLKTANRNEKLTYLDDNIKCGNSLIDDPTIAGDLAFKWEKEFADIMSAGGFDVVVGNPPYVVLSSFENNEFSYLQNKYETSFGRLNTFAIFIEKITQLLNPKFSHSSIIIPDSLCLIDYYAKLRVHLLEKTNIEEIIELGDGVFEEATVPAIIFSISLPKKKKHAVKIGTKESILQGESKKLISQDSYYITPKNSFNLHADEVFLKVQKLVGKGNFDRLEEIIDIKIGICTGGNSQHLSPTPKYENSKKVLQGKDITKYRLGWDGMYVNYSRKELLRARDESIFLRSPKLLMRQTSDSLIVTLDDEQFYTIDSLFTLHAKHPETSLKMVLCLLNSKLLNRQYQILNYEAGRVFAQVKIDYVNELPIPILNAEQQSPFIEKADIMLTKNKELHDASSKFLALLKSEFGLDKLGKNLEQWYTLDFAAFIAELKKKKITLTLAQKSEWMEHFEKQKTTAAAIKSNIDTTDREIDQMVYTLYDLTPEEIQIIEEAV